VDTRGIPESSPKKWYAFLLPSHRKGKPTVAFRGAKKRGVPKIVANGKEDVPDQKRLLVANKRAWRLTKTGGQDLEKPVVGKNGLREDKFDVMN